MDKYYNEYKNRMAILDEVVDYLNDHYNQASEAYNLFLGVKPQIVEYNDSAIISFWACGAIVKINDVLHFISEDDGNWFISEIGHSFHIGWSDSYIDAIQTLKNHIQKKCSNGGGLCSEITCVIVYIGLCYLNGPNVGKIRE